MPILFQGLFNMKKGFLVSAILTGMLVAQSAAAENLCRIGLECDLDVGNSVVRFPVIIQEKLNYICLFKSVSDEAFTSKVFGTKGFEFEEQTVEVPANETVSIKVKGKFSNRQGTGEIQVSQLEKGLGKVQCMLPEN
jgi:hypothetical protein